MLHDAELFVMAEQVLVEVLGRIRDQDWDTVLPPLVGVPGMDRPTPLRHAVAQWADDDARVPHVLTGTRAPDGAPPGSEPPAGVARVAAAACAAAGAVTDADRLVHGPDGDVSTGDYLRRLAISRSVLAHYIAFRLGSTACPLPEELARPLWELTAPEAGKWRSLGVFRDPLPWPENVSWRDRFLLSAGHDPHPPHP